VELGIKVINIPTYTVQKFIFILDILNMVEAATDKFQVGGPC